MRLCTNRMEVKLLSISSLKNIILSKVLVLNKAFNPKITVVGAPVDAECTSANRLSIVNFQLKA